MPHDATIFVHLKTRTITIEAIVLFNLLRRSTEARQVSSVAMATSRNTPRPVAEAAADCSGVKRAAEMRNVT